MWEIDFKLHLTSRNTVEFHLLLGGAAALANLSSAVRCSLCGCDRGVVVFQTAALLVDAAAGFKSDGRKHFWFPVSGTERGGKVTDWK